MVIFGHGTAEGRKNPIGVVKQPIGTHNVTAYIKRGRFRHFSDISCALLCIVGRNRNERRLLGYIDQLLTVALVLRTER